MTTYTINNMVPILVPELKIGVGCDVVDPDAIHAYAVDIVIVIVHGSNASQTVGPYGKNLWSHLQTTVNDTAVHVGTIIIQ